MNPLVGIEIGKYVVNPFTLFIEPVEYDKKLYSRIVEEEVEFISPFNPIQNIKHSCSYYGCDYESKRKGTKLLIDYSRKLPIVIEPINGIYAFCTASPYNVNCYWFFLNQIKDYRRISAKQIVVIFHNGYSQTFPISYNSFHSQFAKVLTLQNNLLQRVEHSRKKMFYLEKKPESPKASESNEFYSKDSKNSKDSKE